MVFPKKRQIRRNEDDPVFLPWAHAVKDEFPDIVQLGETVVLNLHTGRFGAR